MRTVLKCIWLLGLQWYEYWKLAVHKARWRMRNPHNKTEVGHVFPMEKVSVGNGTYGMLNVRTFSNDDEHLSIGNYCSIAENVYFILGGDHRYNTISTYPFGKLVADGKTEAVTKGPVIVEDDVWIGFGTIILSGVTIGRGSVIGAGSVITKDIAPYSVVCGVPARLIRYRHEQSVIDQLNDLDFSQLNETSIREHIEELKSELSPKSPEEIRNLCSWFPKRSEKDNTMKQ